MSCKIILTPVIALDEDTAALQAAAELAQRFDAAPIALILAVHLSSAYMDRDAPLSAVLHDITAGASSRAARLREELTDWLSRSPQSFEVRDLAIEHAVDDDKIAAQARLADLIIVSRAAAHNRARNALIEDLIFQSGRPVLLMPELPLKRRAWDKIVIGWNARAEAVRAVAGAIPFLPQASRLVVATVDARAAESSGPDLAAYLKRHGGDAEVRNLDGLGRTEAASLLDEAAAIDADLLVVGAYGHSRAREWLFGGVTRELLATSPIPLLMAH